MEQERDRIVIVLHVKPEERSWLDHIIHLVGEGLQHTSGGLVEWDGGWVLDDTDDRLLTGLGVLHGEYPASTFGAEAAAWNSAREQLGAQPHPVPAAPRPEDIELAQRDFRPPLERQSSAENGDR